MVKCRACKEEVEHGYNMFTSKGWKELSISGFCESCFDDITISLYENLPFLDENITSLCTEGVILAGGALRKCVDVSDTIVDYDLFVLDVNLIEPLKSELVVLGYSVIFECPEGKLISYKDGKGTKVQIINKRPYSSVEDIINSFDIIASCAALSDGMIYTNDRFISNVLHKVIDFNKVEYPVATMSRIEKYINKGYKLSKHGKLSFIKLVNGMEIDENNLEYYID